MEANACFHNWKVFYGVSLLASRPTPFSRLLRQAEDTMDLFYPRSIDVSVCNTFFTISSYWPKVEKSTGVVTTRFSHSHLFEIIATLLIYTPLFYFNRIKIYSRLITHDT